MSEARLKKMSRTVKMPGFRPGKVPFRMVAQSYGLRPAPRPSAPRSSVLGEIRAQNLRVAGYPSIEPKESAGTDALESTAVRGLPRDRHRRRERPRDRASATGSR